MSSNTFQLTNLSLRDKILESGDDLRDALRKFMADTIFRNQYTFHPRKISEFAQNISDSLVEFLTTGDSAVPHMQGKNSADLGINSRTMLELTELLHRNCFKYLKAAIPKALHDCAINVDRYMIDMLEGYIARRQEKLLDEQERTHRAFLKAHLPGKAE